MNQIITALVGKYPQALDNLVKHVRENYVPHEGAVSNQVVEMWHKDVNIQPMVTELMVNYSDAENEIEFLTRFFSYAPLVLAASIALRFDKIHPKDFFLVCDRTQCKPAMEACALAILRSMAERCAGQRTANNTFLEPVLNYTELGFRRQVFSSDQCPPHYQHHELVAAYNHIYLFLS